VGVGLKTGYMVRSRLLYFVWVVRGVLMVLF